MEYSGLRCADAGVCQWVFADYFFPLGGGVFVLIWLSRASLGCHADKSLIVMVVFSVPGREGALETYEWRSTHLRLHNNLLFVTVLFLVFP